MLLKNLDSLLEFLASYPQHHARDSAFYKFIDTVMKAAFREIQADFQAGKKVTIAELGPIDLPYEKMGAIDSIDLFGLDELLLFAFYWKNTGRYARAADIGANIGLHSIVLSKCGNKVEAFEPDPNHGVKLLRNLGLNGITTCTLHKAAVSESVGTMQFVRVLGNTTSSHLAGTKANPYGDLERFDVEVQDIKDIAARVDFMKIDAEGHESVILKAVPLEQWKSVDAMVEIGTPENAQEIFSRFDKTGVNIFVQKRGWARAASLADIPTTYKEGSVFISCKPAMPW